LGLRERKPRTRHAMTGTPYAASRYSPNTDLRRSEISPSVA
jgi:hypothetical protein